jgi:hypothetical protein
MSVLSVLSAAILHPWECRRRVLRGKNGDSGPEMHRKALTVRAFSF